jgi:hypothetical protein
MRNLMLFVSLLLVSSTELVLAPISGKTQTSGALLVVADETIKLDSYTCTGDVDKLTSPCQNAVDGEWKTKLTWNNTLLGDFCVIITENYSLQDPTSNISWKFKAYHYREGSLIPKPMRIEFWNGSSWKELYELDDTDHTNEDFIEVLSVPKEALVKGKTAIKTTLMYSSHVAGAIPPSYPERLLHYVEFFEAELSSYNENNGGVPISFLFAFVITAAIIFGGLVIMHKRSRPRGDIQHRGLKELGGFREIGS